MRLFLCYVCPPLAVFFCWRPFSAVLNVFLTLFGWVPGIIHAGVVYGDFKRKEMANAIHNPKWTQPQTDRGFRLGKLFSPAYTKELAGDIRDIWKGQPAQPAQLPAGKGGKPPPINDPHVGANGTRFKRAPRG